MRAELDLSTSFTMLIDDISDSKCGDFANPQTCIDRKRKSETISLGMSSGLDNAKHASNIVFCED
jgi:hypothetical protein